MIRPEFKASVAKTYNISKFIYLVLVHVLLIAWSPFITYTDTSEAKMLNIDFSFIHKDLKQDILITK